MPCWAETPTAAESGFTPKISAWPARRPISSRRSRAWSMSTTIWTRCGGKSNFRELALDAWRVVEAQHMVATRKLVDSDEEQAMLESLIERAKPPARQGPE